MPRSGGCVAKGKGWCAVGWPQTRTPGDHPNWGESRREHSSTAAERSADEFIVRTIEIWQPRCQCRLNKEDARQIIENAVGFFSVLAQWDDEVGAGDSSPERGGELP